ACGTLVQGLSKSTLTHHWRVLRESGASYYMTFIFSGLFGAMGSTALSYIWRRFFNPSGR
ncbi:hypothetical protein V1951_22825, partial [Yersinia sp. 2544 StPb PI]